MYQSRKSSEGALHALAYSGLLAFSVTVFGTIGYMLIEGWSAFDSLYMTVITMATVGYSEVHGLSDIGRAFTICLILAGVGIGFYALTAMSKTVVEGEFKKFRGVHQMQRAIEKISEHTIICGYGRLAGLVVQELMNAGQKVVVIENDPARVKLLEQKQILCVEGSAYDDLILEHAGIARAKTLLALLPKDSDNVYVVLSARSLRKDLHIVSRSEHESGENKLKLAGVNQIVSPYRVSGLQIAERIIRPSVSSLFELTDDEAGNTLVIEEIKIPSTSKLAGKKLIDTNLRQYTGAIVAAIIHSDGRVELSPDAHALIQSDSTLVVLGQKAGVQKLSELI